jgi:hypothetical protein
MKRAGYELAILVVVRVLAQRLADTLRNAAVHLALDDHRIDDDAEIVHRRPGDDVGGCVPIRASCSKRRRSLGERCPFESRCTAPEIQRRGRFFAD